MSTRIYQFLVVLAVVISTSAASGAAPQLVNYQGRLMDTGGQPITSAMLVAFGIWDSAIGGNSLWIESQTIAPDSSGLFRVLLGSLNPINDSIFADTNRWIGISLESMAEMSPRVRLASVPYSFRVSTVDGASGGVITGSLSAEVHEDSAQATAGLSVSMDNVSTGITYGGLFSVSDSGTGSHFGVAGSSSQKFLLERPEFWA